MCMRYVYLMHYSRARSLKRDGRDHSLSMKQPAVVPSALARGSQWRSIGRNLLNKFLSLQMLLCPPLVLDILNFIVGAERGA